MTKKFDPHFKPWITNLVWALFAPAFFLIGYKFLFPHYFFEFICFSGACVVFLVWNIKQLLVRTRGQRIEKKALKNLCSYLGNEYVRTSVKLPAGGDADGVIKKDGVYVNLEIKSVTLIERVKRAHLAQVRKAAVQLKSQPVIWLPKGQENRGIELNGVLIFSGDHKRLCRYLGV